MPWKRRTRAGRSTQVPQRAQVVAEVDVAGRLDAREHSGHGRGRLAGAGPGPRSDCPPGSLGPMAYEVSTPVFEGPFDLLLHLILKEQVDIYEVSLAASSTPT